MFLFLSAAFGFLSVALGAFAAHALKARFDEYSLNVFRTGVDYQFYHSLALGLVALIILVRPHRLLNASAWAFVAGMVIFSGSLYLLAFTKVKMWGAVTPIDGLSFLIGWVLLAAAALKVR